MTPAQPALDALEKRLAAVADGLDAWKHRVSAGRPVEPSIMGLSDMARAVRDAAKALRAAPVAVRERAAGYVSRALDALTSGPFDASDPRIEALAEYVDAIRALPLDAPAPVDPVAEAARVLLEQDAELPIGPNGYCLPSGLTFSPNGRIIGIDDDLAVFEGYDGPLAPPPGKPVEDGDWHGDLQNIPPGDKAALARMMIGRWTQFAGNALAQEARHD
jgi:hypothetical protein